MRMRYSEVEVRCRIQDEANAWGKVEGVMLDRNILKKLKGKVLRACVTPACLCCLETSVDRTTQQLQVCENNWVRRITRTKWVDKRKKDERPDERRWDAIQLNMNIGEKQGEMGRPLGKDGCRQTSKESRGGKTSRTHEKGKPTAKMGGRRESLLTPSSHLSVLPYFWAYRTSKMMSSWLVVFICVERFVAVCFPLRTKNMCTKRIANTSIAVTLLICGACNAFRVWLDTSIVQGTCVSNSIYRTGSTTVV